MKRILLIPNAEISPPQHLSRFRKQLHEFAPTPKKTNITQATEPNQSQTIIHNYLTHKPPPPPPPKLIKFRKHIVFNPI
ncbi:hypothetical protein M758_12G030600 [Ceratodon purpureus]|nr:hypothetical protein M758_12G030600 [Ceratodon purpureus]